MLANFRVPSELNCVYPILSSLYQKRSLLGSILVQNHTVSIWLQDQLYGQPAETNSLQLGELLPPKSKKLYHTCNDY